MKSVKLITASIIIACASVMLGCKKGPEIKKVDSGDVWFDFEYTMDSTPYNFGNLYAYPTDWLIPHQSFRNLIIDSVHYIIEGQYLVDTNGVSKDEPPYDYALNPAVVMHTQKEVNYFVEAGVGVYNAIEFGISQFNVYGRVDTSLSGTGNPTVPFHFAIKDYYPDVVLPNHTTTVLSGGNFVVQKSQATYVYLKMDYGYLFHGIDLRHDQTTTNANAQQFADNISHMFSYRQ